MRLAVVLRYIGIIMLLNAAFMLLSAGISLINNTDSGFYPLMLSFVLTSILGVFPLIFVRKNDRINMKEAYAIVVGAWLTACIVGTFPYLLWGGEFSWPTAWFESVSGFTTTGSTALADVEALPKGLLFWRSSTHWLGGVGVVMFVLVVLPTVGRTKMTLSSVELSPMAKENYRYKTQKVIYILLSVYLGLTVLETICLKIAGMGWFDAINHAFSTVSTGGFSTKNASIAYYNSLAIEIIIMIFMLMSGLHFGLIFATLVGKRNNIFRNEVSRFYFATFLISGLLITFSLWHAGMYGSFFESLRYSLFQTAAIITTTGFATADTTLWTSLAIMLLLYLMFQCACAGSTSGGIKSDRVWLALKAIRLRILRQQHPNAVIRIKMNGVPQDNSVINFAMFFIVIYIMIVCAGTIIVAATGEDLMTSFSLVATSMGNVGPGFGSIGSMDNYSEISSFVKIFSTIFMLLGRLEIFGLLQLFLMKWWR